MTDTVIDNNRDEDSLLLLLRDAIVQHSPLNDIKLILSCKYVNINGCVRRGLRPIHYAVFENDIEGVRLLVEDYNADVNVLDEAGYSPLHLAAKYGYIEIMHILIDHGSLVNFRKAINDTQTRALIAPFYDVMTEPLSLCLESNHLECACLLLQCGADVNQQYFLGYEINLLSFENHNSLELILKYGANPDALSRSGITPLIKACREGNLGAAILLCRYGANVNYVTRKFRQRNALVTAIESKRSDIVEQLLIYGGFANKHPELCNSPLELAIRKDTIEIVRLLIAFNADTNEETNEDVECTTPLILACQCSYLRDQYSIVKCLLENDANPNQSVLNTPHHHFQHIPYRTPLVAYVKHAHERRLDMRIVRLLIGYGARISFSRGRDSVLRFLRRLQSNPYLIELLCDAAYFFHPSYIAECRELDEKTKEEIYRRATTPHTLKNIARKQIRTNIFNSPKKIRIDRAIQKLDLPNFLQRYLLFENA
ncbi:unnamed protein product [Rotaria socialis]|uniref:SOCS box domain-containing protein n=5 Tax=Rotaria socialis TaxID=392032 RepID=A0A817Z5S9_9BILA|nr:unnamed protein product [Rotaria socialis]CAF3390561.1 unnamed protein product [Rotaria socialis]CAF3448029.1 unnamed protein product [Rotaria socialis]CAF3450763.1 unnamed protein product [Rotaria socialis]CAF3482695.1 unnamed protein product [Rotaria socialis]